MACVRRALSRAACSAALRRPEVRAMACAPASAASVTRPSRPTSQARRARQSASASVIEMPVLTTTGKSASAR
jgi:hypothetical protein